MRDEFFFSMTWGQPDFSWPVCDRGYEWLSSRWENSWGELGRDLFLVDRDEPGPEREWPTYRPLSRPGLFMTFALLARRGEAEQRAGFQDFACKYGLLEHGPNEGRPAGLCAELLDGPRANDKRGDTWLKAGNPLPALQLEARKLSEAVQLWALLQEANPTRLLRWTRPTDHSPQLELDGSTLLWDEVYQFFGSVDETDEWRALPLDQAGRRLLVELVNANAGLQGARLTVSPEGRFFASFAPCDNLLEALWLQFGHAIIAEQRFQQCSECGDVFELTDRNDKKTCSPRCRKRRARRIEAGGVSRKPGRPRRQTEEQA